MCEPGAHQKRMDELLGRIETRLADIDALLAEYRSIGRKKPACTVFTISPLRCSTGCGR
jgi:hypothetical protein